MDNEKNMTDGIEVVQDESMDMSAGVRVETENHSGTCFNMQCDNCGRFTFRSFENWRNGEHRKVGSELDVYTGSWCCTGCNIVNDIVTVRKMVNGRPSVITTCVVRDD